MNEKKPYQAPQVFGVKLNHEQAVLSACTVGHTSLQADRGGDNNCRPQNGCKKAAAAGDSGSPPS
jgi:hypothetical protein